MKIKLVFLAMSLLIVLSVSAAPTSARSQFTVQQYQSQFQWRAWASYGTWSYIALNSLVSTEYEFTGKVLHMAFSFAPSVIDLEGESSIYVYDKASGLWTQHEGTIDYRVPGGYYDDFAITSYWRGYLDFNGPPGEGTFDCGVAYQWVYVYLPESDSSVPNILQGAQWDPVMQAWLIGFSIYIWTSSPYAGSIPFQFAEPVPANDYNPLNL